MAINFLYYLRNESKNKALIKKVSFDFIEGRSNFENTRLHYCMCINSEQCHYYEKKGYSAFKMHLNASNSIDAKTLNKVYIFWPQFDKQKK